MFYEQLKKACKMKKTSITAVLKQIGIGTANGTYWKNGSIPSSDIVVKLAEFLNVSTDYLLLGKETVYPSSNVHIDEPKQPETSSSSPKFINNGTYNGTVNSITGDYAYQENTIEIRKSDSSDVNVSEAALEYDKILNSLNESDREMFISQVHALAGTFKKK